MRIRELISKHREKRSEAFNQIAAMLQGNNKEEISSEIIEILNDKAVKIDSLEKALAIELAKNTQMIEAVPALYSLLKEPFSDRMSIGACDPAEALVAVGKEGLPLLLSTIREEGEDEIPYQTITNTLYHWFDHDQPQLRSFLTNELKKATAEDKPKIQKLLDVMDKWTSA